MLKIGAQIAPDYFIISIDVQELSCITLVSETETQSLPQNGTLSSHPYRCRESCPGHRPGELQAVFLPLL